MSYLKQIWRDLVSGGTTLTADRLNHMEDGIAAANDAWDSVSRTLYAGAGATSVALSDSAESYAKLEIEVAFTQGQKATALVSPGKEGCAVVFGVVSGTTWICFAIVQASGKAASVVWQLNIPVAGYHVGAGNGTVDARIMSVSGRAF